jgi:hypothetical protein
MKCYIIVRKYPNGFCDFAHEVLFHDYEHALTALHEVKEVWKLQYAPDNYELYGTFHLCVVYIPEE